MHVTLRISAIAFSAQVISGCSPSSSETTPQTAEIAGDPAAVVVDMVDPGETCVTPTLDQDMIRLLCKPGQKVAFLPQRWGNEQLPIAFAAFNCDLDATVVVTNGGVVCRYLPQPKRAAAEQETDSADDQPNSEESNSEAASDQG